MSSRPHIQSAKLISGSCPPRPVPPCTILSPGRLLLLVLARSVASSAPSCQNQAAMAQVCRSIGRISTTVQLGGLTCGSAGFGQAQ